MAWIKHFMIGYDRSFIIRWKDYRLLQIWDGSPFHDERPPTAVAEFRVLQPRCWECVWHTCTKLPCVLRLLKETLTYVTRTAEINNERQRQAQGK